MKIPLSPPKPDELYDLDPEDVLNVLTYSASPAPDGKYLLE
jgi:hypothetical protein